MNTEQRKIVRIYWLISSLADGGMAFISTTYVLFLLSRGLNLFEVNLVNVVFFVTLFIFEIPTGAIADIYGRKISTIWSFILLATGTFIYAGAQSFWQCALAEAIGAIGKTCITGAFDAWLVDELRLAGYKNDLRSVFSRKQQFTTIVNMSAAMAGAWLGAKNLAYPWFGVAVVMMLGLIFTIVLVKEKSFMRRKFSFVQGIFSIKDIAQKSITYGIKQSAVRFLLVLGVVQAFAVQAPNMQWSPYFKGLIGNIQVLGFIWWGIAIAITIGATLSPRFLKIVKDEKKALVITQVIIGAGIALTTPFRFVPATLSIFFMHEIARGIYRPLKDAYLNAQVPSSERATLISFESLAQHAGGVIGLIVSGFVANAAGIPTAWMMSGIALIIGTLLIAKNSIRTKNP